MEDVDRATSFRGNQNEINVAAILLGGAIGIFFGARLPERLKATVIAGMGLFVTAIGLQMFLKTENSLVVLGALILVWPRAALTWTDVAVVIALSFAGHIVVNHIGYGLGVRDAKW